MMGLPKVMLSHDVTLIFIRLPGQHTVTFREGHEEEAIVEETLNMVTAFFELCKEDERAKEHTIETVSQDYSFVRGNKTRGIPPSWKRRVRKTNNLCRIHPPPARNLELQAYRALLQIVKGPQSAEEVRQWCFMNDHLYSYKKFVFTILKNFQIGLCSIA